MDSRFQIFGAKTTLDIRSGFLGIVIGPETILPDMSGGPTDFREDWFGLLSSDFCTTSWIFLHDPVCPKTGPVLSKNLVRSVLKPGPFCPGTWSVLS